MSERKSRTQGDWCVAIAQRATDPIDTGTAIPDNARQDPTHQLAPKFDAPRGNATQWQRAATRWQRAVTRATRWQPRYVLIATAIFYVRRLTPNRSQGETDMRASGKLVSLVSLSEGKAGAYFRITTSTNCVPHRSQHSFSFSFYAVVRAQDQNIERTLSDLVARKLQGVEVDTRCRHWKPNAECLETAA
jgi:hypothetical protein